MDKCQEVFRLPPSFRPAIMRLGVESTRQRSSCCGRISLLGGIGGGGKNILGVHARDHFPTRVRKPACHCGSGAGTIICLNSNSLRVRKCPFLNTDVRIAGPCLKRLSCGRPTPWNALPARGRTWRSCFRFLPSKVGPRAVFRPKPDPAVVELLVAVCAGSNSA